MKMHVAKTSFIVILPLLSELAYAQAIDGFIADQIQNQVSRQISSGISKNLNENLLIPMLKIRNESGEVKDFSLSSDERYYNLLHQDGTVRVWDSKQGVQRPTIQPAGRRFSKVVSSSAAGIVCVGGEDGRVNVFDIPTAKPVTELAGVSGEAVVAMSVSKAENKLAAAFADGTIVVWDLNGYQNVAKLNTRHENELTRIAFTDSDKSLLIAGEGGFSEVWDLDQARKKSSLPKQSGDPLGAWESNSGDLINVDSDGNLQWLEQPGGQVRLNKKIDAGDDLVSVAVSFNANLLALSTNANQIKLFNLNGLTLAKQIATPESISHLQFINQGKQLVGADQKGVLHVWDSGMATELLKLISTDSGWTVVDNAGRFDSSEAGMPNVSWVAADKDIPIDNFSGNYYEPGLLATHLTKDAFINQPPRKVQEGITLPPDVSLTLPASGAAGDEIEVSFLMLDAGGGLGDHRLYHNGKIVDKSLLEDSSDSEVNGKAQRKVSYNVVLTAGANTFKVVAANMMGIDSQPQQQIVQVGGADTPAKLHVLTVGIDKYSDSKLNLAYSVADAKAIESTLNANSKVVFRDVVMHDLLDQNATKSSITDKLTEIAADSQNDVLVVYLAGHGIAMKGEWYFLPHETRLPISEQYISNVGVSAKQIQALLAKIPVQKVLVMIDSCYSGAGLSALQNLQNTQRHFSRALSKTVGVVVLTATRQDQEAMELTELGHGLFTYVTNNGMQGAADTSPRDQKISAHELVTYSTATIPTFSKKYSAASQEPSSFTIGDDFVLLKQ
ncbi:caspase family protein [Methylomonas sp. LL1]|uniref:caspase family protein n=1 Tax=Methylomonas sp. LL1 TaxID=2785785 RepID=UPI0018C36F00|nr:caspase family protein [Methylomonas sp. LL1]QPK63701.1 caspase family protein [Methylomonas sp. LL1]